MPEIAEREANQTSVGVFVYWLSAPVGGFIWVRKSGWVRLAGYCKQEGSCWFSVKPVCSVVGRTEVTVRFYIEDVLGGCSAIDSLLWFAVVIVMFSDCTRVLDPDEMVWSDPSWNTDQGVWHGCEYGGGKPQCAMKVKGHVLVLRYDGFVPAISTDHDPLVKDLSLSIHVGTRKMVNYAWVGWSQGKLWWRLVAILTCKSIVKFGYRGERLIEPSSSWFPPKFPSG